MYRNKSKWTASVFKLNASIALIQNQIYVCRGDAMKSKKSNNYEVPLYLFHQGKNAKAYEFLGSHKLANEDKVVFRVWAPHAAAVSVVGDFNGWDTYSSSLARNTHACALASATSSPRAGRWIMSSESSRTRSGHYSTLSWTRP